MKIAIYPGTFDPVTNGHMDILMRACNIFDKVIMGVAANAEKGPLFSVEERVQLIRENLEPGGKAEVMAFKGLLVNFAKEQGACALVRGLRAVSDFEYEFQMAQMNRHLAPDVETIFLMPNEEYFFTSSRLIKSVACFDDRVSRFVPENVNRAMRAKFAARHHP